MNFKELQDFIKVIAKSGATEVKIETDELKLTIITPGKGKTAQGLTETTLIQQIPVATQVSAIPQMQMAPTMQSPVMPQQVQQVQPVAQAEPKQEETKESNYITVKSPMVGTFYRKPAPEKPTFVNVGDDIAPGKVVCIIEAMKLFNEIESEVSGKVIKVLVDDASPVEFDQPLYLVDPS